MFAPRGFAQRTEDSEPEAGRQARPLSGLNFADVPLFPPVQPKLADDRAAGGQEHADGASSRGRLPLNALRSEPIQAKPQPNRTGMPDRLKAGIESLSGIDMSDVRVHANSDRPARLNALAYTQGNQIYMGPGQERHLAHEAWHAVQQKQGRVRATGEIMGVGVNDEVGLEEEADRMSSVHSNKDLLSIIRDSHNNLPKYNEKNRTHAVAFSQLSCIQRKLGLELELDVLIDKNQGTDVPSGTEILSENLLKIKTDHGKNLKADKGKGEYSSIVELVTEAYDFENDKKGSDNLHIAIERAIDIALLIEKSTESFKKERALNEIFSGAKQNY
jgi:hypothetical protein